MRFDYDDYGFLGKVAHFLYLQVGGFMTESRGSALLAEISRLVLEIEAVLDEDGCDSGSHKRRTKISALVPQVRKALVHDAEKAERIGDLLATDGKVGEGLAALREEEDRVRQVRDRSTAICSLIRMIREVIEEYDDDVGSDELNQTLCSRVVPEVSRVLGNKDPNTAEIEWALEGLGNPASALQILLSMLPPGESC